MRWFSKGAIMCRANWLNADRPGDCKARVGWKEHNPFQRGEQAPENLAWVVADARLDTRSAGVSRGTRPSHSSFQSWRDTLSACSIHARHPSSKSTSRSLSRRSLRLYVSCSIDGGKRADDSISACPNIVSPLLDGWDIRADIRHAAFWRAGVARVQAPLTFW